jgi:predicted NodU family carbamoyl transferase
MIHLGISYGHTATVATLNNGILENCVSEERFNRLKNSCGFPWMAYQWVLDQIAGGGGRGISPSTFFKKA